MTIREAAETIKRTVTMSQILSVSGYTVDRAGFMPCPFHAGDHTASLKVYKGTRGWSCFGCHRGGTVIDFVMLNEDKTFTEAVKTIDEDLHLHLLESKPVSVSSFFRSQSAEQRDIREYNAFRAALKAKNEADTIRLELDWYAYQLRASLPRESLSAADRDWLMWQAQNQPMEWEEYWNNKRKEKMSIYEWRELKTASPPSE